MTDQTDQVSTVRRCHLTGEETTGKLYVLRTTEGEELVSPEALFHPQADSDVGRIILDMAGRIQRLEELLLDSDAASKEAPAADIEEEASKEAAPPESEDRIEAAAAKAAAPVKRTPRQRKASD